MTSFIRLVVPQVPRALALLDRDPGSPTCGCFDRPFWYYRTLVDFAGATWQQLVWPLAWLYRLRHPDNPYAGDGELLRAVDFGLRWWARIQHRDGSFDEWYRNEHSYCPTAFTTAAASEAMLLLGDELSAEARAAAAVACERAAAWLEPRFNPTVMNQNVAAGLALWNVGLLTSEQPWRQAAEAKFAQVAAAQRAEGWLPEYGGADFGYSTVALDLLAVADGRGAGTAVRPIAQKLIRFLVDVHGAGAGHPGRLGSRGTSHLFTFGASHFASDLPAAATLADGWRSAYDAGLAAGPADIDDRYFAYFYLPHFALACSTDATAPATANQARLTHLPGAGFTIVRGDGWSVTVSARLGGALAVERADGPPCYFLGYELALASGSALASHHWDAGAEIVAPAAEGGAVTVRCRAAFARHKHSLPLVRWSFAFHLFTRLLSAGGLAEAFQSAVKRRMINPRARREATLERTVTVGESELMIRDEIRLLDPRLRVASLRASGEIVPHSPSARQDCGETLAASIPADAAARLTRERTVVLEHRFPLAAPSGRRRSGSS